MAQIKYNGYSFYDDNQNDKNVYDGSSNDAYVKANSFNIKHLQQLIDTRDYTSAYDYLKSYHFENLDLQKEADETLNYLRYNSRKERAIHSRIINPDLLEKVKFGEVVLSGSSFDLTGNQYYDEYGTHLRNLGSNTTWIQNENGEMIERPIDDANTATALSITFEPKTRKFLGLIDWMTADNPYSFENLCENMGVTAEYFMQHGIKPVLDNDGNITIQFDKTNPIATSILYHLPTNTADNGEFMEEDVISGIGGALRGIPSYKSIPKITGLNSKGEVIKTDTYNGDTGAAANSVKANPLLFLTQVGQNVSNALFPQPIDNINENFKDYRIGISGSYQKLKASIFTGIKAKEDAYTELKENERTHSSVIAPLFTDDLEQIKSDYNAKLISEQEYNRLYNQSGEAYIINNVLKVMATGGKTMMSNYANKGSDEILREMDADQRHELRQLISGTKSNNIHVNSMLSDGTYGLLVTIDAKLDDDGEVKTPEYQVFIPGLMVEECQKALGRDTRNRSMMEITSMQDYGGEYKTDRGDVIAYIGDNYFLFNGQTIGRDDAVRLINKDMIVTDAKRNLPWQHMSAAGQIENTDKFKEQAMITAIAATNELYPDTPYRKLDGTGYTMNELMSIKGVGNNVTEEGLQNMPYNLHPKVVEFYDIYEQIVKSLEYFK